MATFSPRAVDPGNLKIWMREALALTTRKVPTNVALALLLAVFGLLPGAIGTYLTLFLCPLWLMLFCLTAEAADYHRPSLEVFSLSQMREVGQRVLPLFGMFVAYMALVVAFGFMLTHFADFLSRHLPLVLQGKHAAKAVLPAKEGIFNALSNISAALGSGLIVQHAYGLALASPLSIFHGLGYAEASALSREAHYKNWLPLLGATGFLCIISIVLSSILGGVLIIALLPFAGALFYAAYRDIFLGRMENQPKPAVTARLAQTAAS